MIQTQLLTNLIALIDSYGNLYNLHALGLGLGLCLGLRDGGQAE